MTGRPTKYNEEIADSICMELMLGRSLRSICDDDWCPAIRTVLGWLQQDTHPFRIKYANARLVQTDLEADSIQNIADTVQIGEKITVKADGTEEIVRGDMLEHRKLRISTRQWNAEKLRPKVYGARQHVEHSGGLTITDGNSEALMQDILDMLATGRVKLPGGIELFAVDDEPDSDDCEFA